MPRLTGRERAVLLIVGSVNFTGSLCISLQAPFYPLEASLKGVPPSAYGFVFGIFNLVGFLSSPLVGNYVNRIGVKLTLNLGVFTTAVSTILFGLLDYVSDPIAFVALSFLIRIFQALGTAAATTAAFAITAATFPNNLACTFATLEVFYGVGSLIGPLVGGALFGLGGFVTPFITLGALMVIDAIAICCVLTADAPEHSIQAGDLKRILKNPRVITILFSIVGVTICEGFYHAILEPHIRPLGLSSLAVGGVFMSSGVVYAVMAPVAGKMCDRNVNPLYLLLSGSILVVVSVFLTGPAPFFSFELSLPLVIAGLAILGLATAAVLVAAFTAIISTAIGNGFPDDISTYALVSGLWSAAFSLGEFIGPSVAGLLMDWVGFENGTYFIVAVEAIIFASLCLLIAREKRQSILVPSVSYGTIGTT